MPDKLEKICQWNGYTEERLQASLVGGIVMKEYWVIFERGDVNWGAYVPDLPGCVAVGDTREEVEQLIHEAIEFHIEGMKLSGLPIPEPTSKAGRVTVAV